MNTEPILVGTPTSGGIAEGVVRIVTDTEKDSEFKEGDILVTTITNPTMVAIISKAAAIVCDIGSITSHPSILARELGIPCIVNTKTGTMTLKHGTKVRVNGDSGEIHNI